MGAEDADGGAGIKDLRPHHARPQIDLLAHEVFELRWRALLRGLGFQDLKALGKAYPRLLRSPPGTNLPFRNVHYMAAFGGDLDIEPTSAKDRFEAWSWFDPDYPMNTL
jgi:hypothetical protein